jgi:nicotinate-nucleotide pyrophosphorylase (carboxylating)
VHGCLQSPAAVLSQLPADLPDQVSRALREDIGSGDVTAALIPARQQARARVLCREAGGALRRALVRRDFRQLDPAVRIEWHLPKARALPANSILCELAGPARPILTGERTALNFLQLLSATASITQRYVEALHGTHCRILDTRKTIPGLRSAQKYAVRCGGGSNHRWACMTWC